MCAFLNKPLKNRTTMHGAIILMVFVIIQLFCSLFPQQIFSHVTDVAFNLSNTWSELCYRVWYPILVKIAKNSEVMAAQMGSSAAMFDLGCRYESGDETRKMDLIAAKKWYLKAAKQGHVEAMYRVGAHYCQDPFEAFDWLQTAALQGHPNAQCSLGWCYWNGNGVQENKAEAVKWWRKADAQGIAHAHYGLGIAYCQGAGVEKDETAGIAMIHMAAEQGDFLAQLYLHGEDPFSFFEGN